MREAVVAIQVDSGVSVVATEPLAAPRVVVIFSLHHMVSRLEERLLNVKDAVNVENRHDVQCHVLQQVDVVLIIVDDTMEELEDDVEGHLDRDGLAGVMRTCYEYSWALFSWLRALLHFNKWNITSFICLSKA